MKARAPLVRIISAIIQKNIDQYHIHYIGSDQHCTEIANLIIDTLRYRLVIHELEKINNEEQDEL